MSTPTKPYDQMTEAELRECADRAKASGHITDEQLKLAPIVMEQFRKLRAECMKQGVPSAAIIGALLTEVSSGMISENPLCVFNNQRFERCMERSSELLRVSMKQVRKVILNKLAGGKG